VSAERFFISRVPGQHFDLETGLADNGVRTYDSNRGGFDQPCPTVFNGGIGLYAYGYSDPLIYIDPPGLFPFGRVAGSV